MKFFLVLIFFSCVNKVSIAQTGKLDSLISQLNNSQVIDDGDFIGPVITLRGSAVSKLLDIGKPATGKLFAVLEDTAKGIIAHCILSRIWEQVERPKCFYSEKDTIVFCTYNKLPYFRKPKQIYTNSNYLRQNKIYWELFLKGKQ